MIITPTETDNNKVLPRKQQTAIHARGWLKVFSARLSRRLVFITFCCIVVIEAIILIPSVLRREKEFLNQISEVSEGKVATMKLVGMGVSDRDFFNWIRRLQELDPVPLTGELQHKIIGGTLDKEDKLFGSFGEEPVLSLEEINAEGKRKLVHGDRFDSVWTPDQMGNNYTLVLRHDISTVRPELIAFMWRIAGLVLIISTFVTLGVWLALEPAVVSPILCLREDLIVAGEAISADREAPSFQSSALRRTDELGDVIAAFNTTFQQISEAIDYRKQAEAALQNSLQQVEAYSKVLNLELEKGRQMQRNFLPTESMQIYGWEFSAFFSPARQVAGDFYDTFELESNFIALVIADVCDKGVGAALFMALFRSLIRIFARETKLRGNASAILEQHKPASGHWLGESPQTNLAHLNALQAVCLTNEYVAANHGELGMFATMFFGILDPLTGLVTYINGGHEPVFVIDLDGNVTAKLESTGPAVGMLPDLKFKIAQTILKPGDTLLGYTDGVPEARNSEGTFFTMERLLSVVSQKAPSATALVENIAAQVLNFKGDAEQFDDITLLALKRA